MPLRGLHLMLHRTCDRLMRQCTMTLNAARAHLAEFGIITAQGPHKLLILIRGIRTGEMPGLPVIARAAFESLTSQFDTLTDEIRKLERQLKTWHRADETSHRLETIPEVGVITATALAASVPDPSVFKTCRQFAAFLGLVPRQHSSGGKDRLGRISKMGDGYLRRLLVVGATSVVRRANSNPSATGACIHGLLERKPARLVSVAVANKTARIVWALLVRGETYRAPLTV
jgi:transposase